MLGYQKHPYVGKIPKKSLQGSIHAQFYITIKGPFSRFLLQLCTVSEKRHKNKFPTLRRCGILVKVSPDGYVQKWAQTHSDWHLLHGCLQLKEKHKSCEVKLTIRLTIHLQTKLRTCVYRRSSGIVHRHFRNKSLVL